MNCNQVQELMVLYILEELDTSTSEQIDQHLSSRCGACELERAALLEGVSLLYQIAPRSTLSAEREAQIFQRATDMQLTGQQMDSIDASSALDSELVIGEVQIAKSKPRAMSLLTALASVAAGIVAAAWILPNDAVTPVDEASVYHTAENSVAPEEILRRSGMPAFGAVADVPAKLKLPAERFRTTFISSRRQPSLVSQQGIVIFDRLSREVHFYGRAFTPPAVEFQYVLWLAGSGIAPLPAILLDIAADGFTQGVATNPSDDYEGIFITLEPRDGILNEPSSAPELVLEV